jgi:hypothetical protein
VLTVNEAAHTRGDAECVGSIEMPQVEEVKVGENEETTKVDSRLEVLENIEEEVKPTAA